MGVLINHAISFLTSPLSVAMAMFVVAAILILRRQRFGAAILITALVWLYAFASGWMCCLLGENLERMYPPQTVEAMPTADAIVVLGGGVYGNTNELKYAELFISADRVAHAARLYKAGKAKELYVTYEWDAEVLGEFGVPREAIHVSGKPRNTEEEIRFLCSTFKHRSATSKPKVLLVTSAWHMRRAMLMCAKYANQIEVVPAATDYEALVQKNESFDPRCLLPSADSLVRTTYAIKEYIGYYGYRFLRK